MDLEKSITRIDDFVGMRLQIMAYGTSYVGVLKEVNNEDGFLLIQDGKDGVTLELERIESYRIVEGD